MALIAGGNVNNGVLAGLFCFNVNNAPSNANWNIGASQSYTKTISVKLLMPVLFLTPKGGKISPQKAWISRFAEYP